MKVFFHFCTQGFSNCYIVGTEFEDEPGQFQGPPNKDDAREAIIVDPGSVDNQIIDFIEKRDYKLVGVLFTHDHATHTGGLKTLKKIFDIEILSAKTMIAGFKSTRVSDGEIIKLGPFIIEVISIPGHSSDSVVYKIEQFLFTGDTLSAGLVGSTASSSGLQVQMTSLRGKIFSLPGDHLVLPGHGPPSTLAAERLYNINIKQYEQHKDVSNNIIYWDDME